MKKRIGILTSGGDCPGLNAAIRGVGKAAIDLLNADMVGILGGYKGLIQGDSIPLAENDFSGILTLGGTILRTSRQPFKNMRVIEDDKVDKVAAMKKNYEKWGLDALVILGGNGTHKTANLLAQEGLNVVGLPKTIDNDLYGTDITFGFQSAVDIATESLDRLSTTASSHDRVMVVELMGNSAGWLTLYAGIAGGASVILLPEIPYNIDAVYDAISRRMQKGKRYALVAVAEGAISTEEAKLSKKELRAQRAVSPFSTVSFRIAQQIQQNILLETRVVVPGHVQRGGEPCPYDRVLSTRLGVHAAYLIKEKMFGCTVAVKDGIIGENKLSDIAGLTKRVSPDHELIRVASHTDASFGI